MPRRAVFVHGAGGGAFEWVAWVRSWQAQGWTVHCPELVPVPEGLAATRFEDYRAQVWSDIGQAGGPCVLVGASLGGLLALACAGHPAVRAVVLVNPVPPRDFVSALPPATADAVKAWSRTASLAGTARALPDADPATWEHVWRLWRDESGEVLREVRAGIVVHRPACPVLVVISERDADVPPVASRALAGWLGADMLDWPDASHVGPLLGRRAAACATRVHHWLVFRLGESPDLS